MRVSFRVIVIVAMEQSSRRSWRTTREIKAIVVTSTTLTVSWTTTKFKLS